MQRRAVQHPFGASPIRGAPASGSAAVPFDYAVSFPIHGRPGATHESVINISAEGPFVALGIGYGFEQERGETIADFPSSDAVIPVGSAPGKIPLSAFPVDVLIDGLRVGPRYLPVVFETSPTPNGVELSGAFSASPVSADYLRRTPVFERFRPPTPLDFFFTLIDTASGREFQDQPTFSVASLGDASGRRPFRMLPAPVTFQPRTTVRAQIIEGTEQVSGTLFIVLFGYKLLGNAACPPAAYAMPPTPAPVAGNPRVIPFDYVTRFNLSGQPGNRLEDEVSINVEGGFFATSIGYGLQAASQEVPLRLDPTASSVKLGELTLDQLPVSALVDGFRLKPGFLRLAISGGGTLNAGVPAGLAQRLFETLNRPEDVSFRYTLADGGSGRDLQNQAIYNVAGLGAADGDRPFKRFARPLEFKPRSTLRVTIDEHFGRGQLYVVLQGYKLLEGSALGGRA